MDCATSLATCCVIWIACRRETQVCMSEPVTGFRAHPSGPAARPAPRPTITSEESAEKGRRHPLPDIGYVGIDRRVVVEAERLGDFLGALLSHLDLLRLGDQ